MERNLVVRDELYDDNKDIYRTNDSNLVVMTTRVANILISDYRRKVDKGLQDPSCEATDYEKLLAKMLSIFIKTGSIDEVKKNAEGMRDDKVHEVLYVHRPTDKARIFNLYRKCPDYFVFISEGTLLIWFEERRRLCLNEWTESQVIKYFGSGNYDFMCKVGLKKDKYITLDTCYSFEELYLYSNKLLVFDEDGSFKELRDKFIKLMQGED